MNCPCAPERSYEECCGRFHKGEAWPESPVELMQARYCAFATAEVSFLEQSQHPDHREDVDVDALRSWAKSSEWTGFEVLATEGGEAGESEGQVEFKAHYTFEEKEQTHHEVAHFEVQDGKWYFVDGHHIGPGTFVREEPKVGRNDPCPCGSGKKYKKCHGGA